MRIEPNEPMAEGPCQICSRSAEVTEQLRVEIAELESAIKLLQAAQEEEHA